MKRHKQIPIAAEKRRWLCAVWDIDFHKLVGRAISKHATVQTFSFFFFFFFFVVVLFVRALTRIRSTKQRVWKREVCVRPLLRVRERVRACTFAGVLVTRRGLRLASRVRRWCVARLRAGVRVRRICGGAAACVGCCVLWEVCCVEFTYGVSSLCTDSCRWRLRRWMRSWRRLHLQGRWRLCWRRLRGRRRRGRHRLC